jgi:hypothetical protein
MLYSVLALVDILSDADHIGFDKEAPQERKNVSSLLSFSPCLAEVDLKPFSPGLRRGRLRTQDRPQFSKGLEPVTTLA